MDNPESERKALYTYTCHQNKLVAVRQAFLWKLTLVVTFLLHWIVVAGHFAYNNYAMSTRWLK